MDNEILKPFPKNKNLPVCAVLIGITNPNPSYKIIREASGVSVIEYVLEGEGFVTVKGKEHLVKPNTVYILKEGENHSYRANPKNPWKKIFINFTGDFVIDILREYKLSDTAFFKGEGLKEEFLKIARIISSRENDFYCQRELSAIFLNIVTGLALKKNEQSINPDALKMKELIDGNIDKNISNDELANAIYRSKDFALKLFKKEFGVTPHEYLLRAKLGASKNLLKNTSLSIMEISDRFGFCDAKYYSGVFKKFYGKSPGEYRKFKRRH